MFGKITIQGKPIKRYVEEKMLENQMKPTELEKIIKHLAH